MFDLSVSNPTECGFKYNRPAILKALSQPAALRYEPNPKGLMTARRAIAKYHATFGKKIATDDIFLTTGTSEAYAFVFRVLCNPGDEILVPEPSYPLLNFLADIQDVKLVRYPLLYDHGWQIDFHALEKVITPCSRGLVVVNPNNPTGHFTKAAEMKSLNEICSARQMAIIADEVFLDFSLTVKRPVSFAANKEALTFTMSGLSKIAGLPQMKASWLITGGPEELKSHALARLEVIADTYLSMNTPVQLAIPTLLKQRRGFQKQVMAARAEKSSGTRSATAPAEILRAFGGRRRLECGVACPGYSFGRGYCYPIAKREECLSSSRAFLRLFGRWLPGRQPDNFGKGIRGRNQTRALHFLKAAGIIRTSERRCAVGTSTQEYR